VLQCSDGLSNIIGTLLEDIRLYEFADYICFRFFFDQCVYGCIPV